METSHDRQKQTLEQAFIQMLCLLCRSSDTDAYSKYFLVSLFKSVQQSYNKGYPFGVDLLLRKRDSFYTKQIGQGYPVTE